MRLGQIQKRKLITEGMNDPQLTLMEQRVIQPWVASVEQYVFEAALSQDQIKQLFGNIEQAATDAGGNRTALGKAKDVASLPIEAVKWIDNKINELGRLVQKAGPVKNADAKFEELKNKIGAKDSKVVNAVKAVSDWAKENPGKASIAVGILTAAAAVAGGPLGGAVAGFLARATKDLLQGQKLSTAVGKSIKTAAYGALAGAAIKGITDNIIDNIAIGSEAEADAMMDGFEKANFTAAVDKAVADSGLGKGVLDGAQNLELSGNINAFYYNYDLTMTADQVATYKQLASAASNAKAFSPEYYKAAGELHGWLATTQQANSDLTALAQTIKDIPKDYLTGDQLDAAIAVLDNADAAIEKIMDIGGGAAAAAQGALQTVDDNAKNMHNAKPVSPEEKAELTGDAKESKAYAGKKLSEGQIYLLFNKIETVNTHMLENKIMFESVFDAVSHYHRQNLNEGPLDAIKKGVGKLKQAGKNLTTKVTADKLMKAWNKAGSPTDSDEVYNVIKGLGVADDVIKGTYDSMKIEVPKATDAPDADKDAGAADADTNADAPTDSTAGDGGSDTTDTGAADTNAGGNTPAPTDDATDDTGAESPKAERYYLQKNTKDETKVDIIDKQTSKPIKNGVALAPEKAEPMSDKMNKEAGKFEPMAGERYTMQPNQQNPKTYDVIDTQTDQPVEKGAGLQPGDAEEMRDELNSKKDTTTTQQTSTTSTQDTTNTGATDTDTASTSGGQDDSATTTPTDQVDANKDGLDDKTGNPMSNTRGDGQGQDTAAPQKAPQPADINAIAAELKKLKPEQIEDAKKLLAA